MINIRSVFVKEYFCAMNKKNWDQ